MRSVLCNCGCVHATCVWRWQDTLWDQPSPSTIPVSLTEHEWSGFVNHLSGLQLFTSTFCSYIKVSPDLPQTNQAISLPAHRLPLLSYWFLPRKASIVSIFSSLRQKPWRNSLVSAQSHGCLSVHHELEVYRAGRKIHIMAARRQRYRND